MLLKFNAPVDCPPQYILSAGTTTSGAAVTVTLELVVVVPHSLVTERVIACVPTAAKLMGPGSLADDVAGIPPSKVHK